MQYNFIKNKKYLRKCKFALHFIQKIPPRQISPHSDFSRRRRISSRRDFFCRRQISSVADGFQISPVTDGSIGISPRSDFIRRRRISSRRDFFCRRQISSVADGSISPLPSRCSFPLSEGSFLPYIQSMRSCSSEFLSLPRVCRPTYAS